MNTRSNLQKNQQKSSNEKRKLSALNTDIPDATLSDCRILNDQVMVTNMDEVATDSNILNHSTTTVEFTVEPAGIVPESNPQVADTSIPDTDTMDCTIGDIYTDTQHTTTCPPPDTMQLNDLAITNIFLRHPMSWTDARLLLQPLRNMTLFFPDIEEIQSRIGMEIPDAVAP